MTKLKIGITIDLRVSLFSNGINQNAIYLANLFSEMGHEAVLIGPVEGENAHKSREELDLLGLDLNIMDWVDIENHKWDVIVSLGITVDHRIWSKASAKNQDVKLVRYQCGNHFFLQTEMILFGGHPDRQSKTTVPDRDPQSHQIWSIPQMENTNLDFYSYIDGDQRNATVVPFVWDPMVIESYIQRTHFKEWEPGGDSRKIGIMEPNIGIMKHMIYPMVACSRYLNDGNRLDAVHSYSTSKLSTNKDLIRLVRMGNPDLLGKFKALGRFPTIKVLNDHVDAVLSWQMENALNYLYLDIAWLGWPIIHKAHLCPDIGYYYPHNDMQAATDQMKLAFEAHDAAYKEEQRAKIKRYTYKNKQLHKDYQKLLDNLVNDSFKKQTYDLTNNSIQDL